MASRENYAAGTGVTLYSGANTSTLNATYGSLLWLPLFVTTQSSWASSVTTYAPCTDLVVGSQVVSGSNTYVCITAPTVTSATAPSSGTTTPGATTGTLADGSVWLCIGNATADFTTLGIGYQAVSQITFDSRASQSQGDPMIEIGVSLATGLTAAAGNFVTAGLQMLNPDGTTYADGLGTGANQSGPMLSQGNMFYGAGAATPIKGRALMPMSSGRGRGFLQNNTTAALSASTHVVSFRTLTFTNNA